MFNAIKQSCSSAHVSVLRCSLLTYNVSIESSSFNHNYKPQGLSLTSLWLLFPTSCYKYSSYLRSCFLDSAWMSSVTFGLCLLWPMRLKMQRFTAQHLGLELNSGFSWGPEGGALRKMEWRRSSRLVTKCMLCISVAHSCLFVGLNMRKKLNLWLAGDMPSEVCWHWLFTYWGLQQHIIVICFLVFFFFHWSLLWN